MIDPNEPIPVTLAAMQWNAVLAQLDEGPHRVMRGLIDAIRGQCMAHDTQPPRLSEVVPFDQGAD